MSLRSGRPRGVTLIELMVAVAIVAILALIATPAYRDYRLKAGRGVGESCLIEAAQRFDQHYARTMKGPPAVGLADVRLPVACGDEPQYRLSIDAGSACVADESAGHYALRATPTGAQADDGILVLCVSPAMPNPSERHDRRHARPDSPDALLAGWNFQPGH